MSGVLSFTSFILLLISFSINLFPQNNIQEMKKVAAGVQYDASKIHRFFAGDLWRDLWVQEFNIPILDLENFAGGLTPLKAGGGMQTKSLHLMGADGKRYKFRTLDKDPSRSLPPEFKESLVADAMKDQVPVQNPVSAIIVAGLMNAVYILNAEPALYLMPDSDILQEFRKDFANLPGTIEENPDDYDDDSLNFAGSQKISSTIKLFERLEKDNDEQVDQCEFLKARLFDIFVGDRDRHSGQWNWAGFKEGKNRKWVPIPKDRDYAFPLYNGVIPKIMTLVVTSMVHFDYEMPMMFDITWSGRHLDRRFLGTLDKRKWDSVAVFMKNRLTDNVIEQSVQKIPQELFDLSGDEIINKLKSRRDNLLDAAEEYYGLIMRYADVYGSDKKEFAEIKRIDNNSTLVRLYKRSKSNEKTELIIEKTYDHQYTKELRIHLLGDDDKVVITGEVENGIKIIVDGGDGADELIDSSIVKGKLFGFLPVNHSLTKTLFFDSGIKTVFETGSSTKVNTRPWKTYLTTAEKYEPEIEDRFRDFMLLFPFEINSDNGLIYGLGGRWNFYDFRVEPYSYQLSISGAHSIKSQAFEFIAEGDFNKIIEGANFNLQVKATGLEINKFYGFGNETLYNEKLDDEEFYNIDQRKYSIKGIFTFPLTKLFDFSVGLSAEHTDIKEKDNSLMDVLEVNAPGTNKNLSFLSQLTFDSRDNFYSPHSGFYLKVSAEQFPISLANEFDFGFSSFEGRAYFSGKTFTHTTLAIKLFGKYVWGDYPFYKAANIGGHSSLRRFAKNRFSGDAATAIQTELRFLLGTVTLFIPGQIGINVFGDTGRVFLTDHKSNKWHFSQGGGLWFSILNRTIVFSLNAANSPEGQSYYLNIGQSF